MTDKERILSAIITKIIPEFIHSSNLRRKCKDCVDDCTNPKLKLKEGDLVFKQLYHSGTAVGSVIGFVHEVTDDDIVIREIGSTETNKYNPCGFYRINKEKLGYEILEGLEYRIYQNVLVGLKKIYGAKLEEISFYNNECRTKGYIEHKHEEERIAFEYCFRYSKKTTAKYISEILKLALEEHKSIWGIN